MLYLRNDHADLCLCVKQMEQRSRAVHSFSNDALAVDVRSKRAFQPRRFGQVAMEVRRVVLSSATDDAFGVFVAGG